MGVVYEVDDLDRGQRIALKTLKHRDPDTIYRLKREFRSLADLSHPNLVDLYDLVVDGSSCFLTMELIHGQGFIDYCRDDDGFDERRLRAVLPQLAEGIYALHQAGMVHRDIKPPNVVVTGDGRVVLLDFGLVADMSREDSLAGRIIGTVEYMAPEQAAGDAPTGAADWYGVGVLLYEVLTGRVPFRGSIMEVLLEKQQHPATPPRAIVPDVPEDLDALCVDLLARSPERRPDDDRVLARLGIDRRVSSAPRSTLTSLLHRGAFAGRTDELDRLHRSMEHTRTGRAAAVLVRGNSGMGKSSLIRHFIEREGARDPDVVVFEGRCYEREDVPYKAMDGIIDQLASYWLQLPSDEAATLLPPRAALLRRLFPTLGRVPAVAETTAGPPIHDPQELRSQAFASLRAVFESLAAGRRVILFLDDLQWVDADSVGLLSELLRPPDPPPVLLVMSARREGAPAELERLLRDLEIDTASIDLAPLPPETATTVARGLLHGPAEKLAPRVAQESQGIPIFIEELALYLQTVAPDSIGRLDLDQVVDRRLEQLPDSARELLELTAVSGEPLSRRVAGTALEHAQEDISKEVRFLRTALLLRAAGGRASDRLEVYHDRLRHAVRRQITPGRRRELHRALALALEQWSEGSSERLARHWHQAGEEQRAAELACKAAEEASATVDFDRAARLYHLALSVGRYGPDERRALVTAHGETLANAGRAPEAAEAFLEAARAAEPTARLELRNRAAGELLRSGHVDEGMDVLREVLGELGMRLAPTPRRALASALVRRAWLRLRGLRWKRRRETEIPARELIELDVIASVAISLGNVDTFRAFDFQTRQMLRSLRTGEPTRVARAMGVDAAFLAAQGKRERALELAAEAEALYRNDPSDTPQMPFHMWARAAVHFFLDNDWDLSIELFRATEKRIRQTFQSQGWAMDMAQLYGCFARYARGDYGQLARIVPRLVREAERRGDLYASTCYRTRLNVVYLMRDRVDLAERAYEEAVASWPPPERVGYQVQHYWALMCRSELELYRGTPSAALETLDVELPKLARAGLRRVTHVDSEMHHLEGRAALQVAFESTDMAERGRLLARVERAARCIDAHPRPIDRDFALLLRAGLANVRGDRKRAADTLVEAIKNLDACRSRALAAVARRRLGELRGSHGKLVERADAWMKHQRIRNPARMTHMMIPGFELAE